MKYKLLNGELLDMSDLPPEDMGFLFDLMRSSADGEDYRALAYRVSTSGAYPLKGSPRVTTEVHNTILYRVAEDIADRAAIRQGAMRPDPKSEPVATEGIVSVTEAAEKLGITRSAVIKAAQSGRIRGKKIGHTWALLTRSVETYKVAAHRVEAGRAAHR
ncbi:helix-turn-helix domain-containing protein [bacterium]|nr:helix-turn-helix domain-containing protein [bacterium]